jgi:hypothetical protein
MGMTISPWQVGEVSRGERAAIVWSINHPGGFTTVTSNGDKYRYASSWPVTAALQKNSNNVWVNIWNEATPASSGSWTAWTNGTASLGGTINDIRFCFNGNVSAASGAISTTSTHFEVQGATLVLASANVPQLAFSGSEDAGYEIDARLTNVTTGEYLDIHHAGKIDQVLTIDTESKTVYTDEAEGVLDALSVPVRAEWLKLSPGTTNVIRYTETGVADVDIGFTWYDRAV